MFALAQKRVAPTFFSLNVSPKQEENQCVCLSPRHSNPMDIKKHANQEEGLVSEVRGLKLIPQGLYLRTIWSPCRKKKNDTHLITVTVVSRTSKFTEILSLKEAQASITLELVSIPIRSSYMRLHRPEPPYIPLIKFPFLFDHRRMLFGHQRLVPSSSYFHGLADTRWAFFIFLLAKHLMSYC